MKFTVFGAKGFIGGLLGNSLRADGFTVYEPGRYERDFFNHDLGHILYCAGLTADFRSRPVDTMHAHIGLLSELIGQARFDSLLYLSSTRVYKKSFGTHESSHFIVDPADPSDLYNLSKLAGESLCLNCGREAVRIVRLSNVYGGDFSSDNFLMSLIRDAIDKGSVTLETSRDSAKDYISVNDVITLLKKIALSGREKVYNVASGVNVTNGEILSRLSETTGCNVNISPNAPQVSFPRIDIGRLQQEFDFSPSLVLEDMPTLVRQFRDNKND